MYLTRKSFIIISFLYWWLFSESTKKNILNNQKIILSFFFFFFFFFSQLLSPYAVFALFAPFFKSNSLNWKYSGKKKETENFKKINFFWLARFFIYRSLRKLHMRIEKRKKWRKNKKVYEQNTMDWVQILVFFLLFTLLYTL